MKTPVPRIGCVPYLNARPLLEGLEAGAAHVKKIVPAKLFDHYQAGEFDAALLSSIDVISMEKSEAVDGVSISSRGGVHSVVMAYTEDLQGITQVALDPSSHTSNALLRIVLEEFHGIFPQYVQSQSIELYKNPRLLIGDPALSFRKQALGSDVRFLDLGGEWFRCTGLPFVFALWAIKKDYTYKTEISDLLRSCKILGLSHRCEIAVQEDDPVFALHYLTESICYDLGEVEKRGLKLFADYLNKMKIAQNIKNNITYF